MFNYFQADPRSWASRCVVLVYGFLVLIMVNLYTASSATLMTTTHLSSSINNVHDLAGLKVQTWDQYAPMLARHNVLADKKNYHQ